MNDANWMLMVCNEEGVEFLAAVIKEGFMGGPWRWMLPFKMLANFTMCERQSLQQREIVNKSYSNKNIKNNISEHLICQVQE